MHIVGVLLLEILSFLAIQMPRPACKMKQEAFDLEC